MKAKKVYEMIDPYAEEGSGMGLDATYNTKLKKDIEDWFSVNLPDNDVTVEYDKGFRVYVNGMLDLYKLTYPLIFPRDIYMEVYRTIELDNNLPRIEFPKTVSCDSVDIFDDNGKNADILFPEKLLISNGEYFSAERTIFTEDLPKFLKAENFFGFGSTFKKLPEEMLIRERCSFRKSNITELPKVFSTNILDISNTKVTEILDSAIINKSIIISEDMRNIKVPENYRDLLDVKYNLS